MEIEAMTHFIVTTYSAGYQTGVYHFQHPTPDATLIHEYIRATVAPDTMRTERIERRDTHRLPVDWLTVPVEFTQALARVAATERSV